MANEINIDELQIEIAATSDKAEKSIDKLITVLDNLQTATQRCTGLAKLKNQMEKLAEASEKINKINFGSGKIQSFVNEVNKLSEIQTPNLTKLQNSIEKLAGINETLSGISFGSGNIQGLVTSLESLNTLAVPDVGSLANQLAKLRTAADSLNAMPDISDNVSQFTSAIQPLTSVGSINITSFVTSLKKLPEIATELNSMNFNSFAADLSKVTAAVTPLSSAMKTLASSYSALPANIQKVISNNTQLVTSNTKVEKSETSLSTVLTSTKAKVLALAFAFTRIYSVLEDCLESSNQYVENLNLFTVAMGDNADEALDYAETVNSALGIDTSEWIKNQGVFKQITTGFGVVEDKANTMSKNLTQLGYDISSFFNIDTSEAMTKLQSGISGELEPLRRLGYALDAATLQQIAYNHGIKQNINNMTQAQKSQLRYVAIMEQSENAMGDMARTIITPANSMRILSQQFSQLKRAIGNVVSVFATKLIPYVQVAIRLLTELANTLAEKWGFELPSIDYDSDGLSTATDEMEDYSDAADDAADAVAETVKQVQRLAGFDELNILNPDTTSDSGGTTTDDTSVDTSDWDLDLPEYDFLAGLDEQTDALYLKAKKKLDDFVKYFKEKKKEIEKKIGIVIDIKETIKKVIGKLKDLYNWVKNNRDLVKKFAVVLAAAWGVSKIVKFIDKLKALNKVIGDFAIAKWLTKPFKEFLTTFKGDEATKGASFFTKLKDGVKAFKASLTPLQTILGTIVGILASAAGSYNLFSNLTAGTLTLKKGLADVALIVAGLGVSWLFGGAVGLGIAAVTTAVAALAGVLNAVRSNANDTLDALLDSEWQTAGTNITDYAQGISDTLSELTAPESAFNSATEALGDIKDTAQEASDKIGDLLDGLSPENWDTEAMTEVQDAYADLAKNTKSYADTAISDLQNYISANAGFIEAVGGDVDALNEKLANAKDTTDEKIEEISAKIAEITSKSNISDDDITELKDLYEQLSILSGVDTGPTASSLDALSGEIETLSNTDINLENLDTTQTAIGNIASSLVSAQDELNTAKQNIDDRITYLKTAGILSEEDADNLKDTLTAAFDLKQEDINKVAEGLEPIKDALSDVVDQGLTDIENGYLENFGDFFADELFNTDRSEEEIKKQQQDWLNSVGLGGGADNFIKKAMLESGMSLSDYETIFNTDAAKEAVDTVTGYFGEQIKPITPEDLVDTDKFSEIFSDEAIAKIKENAEEAAGKVARSYVTGLKTNLGTDQSTAISDGLSDIKTDKKVTSSAKSSGNSVARNYVTGFKNGLSDKEKDVTSKVTDFGTKQNNALKLALGEHSPSTITYGYAGNYIQGFVNGMLDKASLATSTVQTLADDINAKFGAIDLTDTGETIGESLADGFKSGAEKFVDVCNTTLNRFESFELEIMNAYNDAVPTFQQIATAMGSIASSTISNIGYVSYSTQGRHIAGFSTGGMPRRADLFFANEDGKPELVGRIGSQTAVANTDQITVAIAAAVKSAILEVAETKQSDGGSDNGDTYIFIDSEEVAYRVEKRQAAKVKRTGG
jgi:hypothetical protein